MSIHYRAQHGEDVWLNDHWSELGLPDRGFFCEVGAADGETVSNTYWLEHERGWRGLLCEPDMRHQITKRPNSIIERCAVGPKDKISLALCRDPFLSGELRQERVGLNSRLVVTERVDVLQLPLTRLLQRHRVEQLHFLSIDTEGTEQYAFETLDLSLYRPRVCIIETNTWGLPPKSEYVKKESLLRAMKHSGYDLRYETQCNGVWVDAR